MDAANEMNETNEMNEMPKSVVEEKLNSALSAAMSAFDLFNEPVPESKDRPPEVES
ncbi:MAG: hypothetical protein HC902_06805 [Calothrix sp. SM1_5_4]|nr:hypothetical protein [Calothrix sp. SM1_5_4]